jgi:hypothetical protein
MTKKLLLVLLPFLFMHTASFAKDYVITPANSVRVVAPLDDISIFDIYQHDTSGHDIYIAWQVVSNDLYPGWDFSFCDLGTCYTTTPSVPTIMDTLNAGGADGFVALNVIPNGIPGTGTLRMYVYQVGYENDGDTLMWTVTAPAVSGISTIENENALRLFPVPASDVLNVGGTISIHEVSISNLSGETISSFQNTSSVPVANLPAGIYLATVRSMDGKTATRRFSKQ